MRKQNTAVRLKRDALLPESSRKAELKSNTFVDCPSIKNRQENVRLSNSLQIGSIRLL